ncbi:MAG: secondary thiamine-phosphate synthase enzyme YjbQ [Candidatus Aenigmatarchaeota archaeon]|nr:secondary thiamine-phosphate synthase enzyme YjbQ [Candidatus Aenigmarchaeota archaeon]
MKVVQKEISIVTRKRFDFIKITKQIEEVLDSVKIRKGIVTVNVPHTTAGVILQEDDETIFKDIINMMEKILPLKNKYHHSHESNENAVSHVASTVIGTNVTLPVIDGKLKLGTWQDIFFVELDKGRNRTVMITIVGE